MLPTECKPDWRNSIGAQVHVYSCTCNSAIGFRPYLLMYRRQPLLPIDVKFRIASRSITTATSSRYIQKLRDLVSGLIRRPIFFSERKHNATSRIMINAVRQCPWGWETQSLYLSLPSRVDTRSKAGGRTWIMWWNGSPIQTYQYMWYVP